MTNITTPTPARAAAPREAVRPAVACFMMRAIRPADAEVHEIPVLERTFDSREALAIDNVTGGGLVARVRAVVAEWCAGDLVHADTVPCYSCAPLVPRILAALGVQP